MGNDFLENIGENELKKSKTINQKNININSLINEQLVCPFCKKIFCSTTTIQEFNIHIKHCGLTSTLLNKACELYPPSQDYELNKKIFINNKKYITISNNKIKNNISLDDKILKLKSEIKNKKISWEEGACQLNLTRNNLLKESNKKYKFKKRIKNKF